MTNFSGYETRNDFGTFPEQYIDEIFKCRYFLACNGAPTSYSNALVKELGRSSLKNSSNFTEQEVGSVLRSMIMEEFTITMDKEGDWTHIVLIDDAPTTVIMTVEVEPNHYVYPNEKYDIAQFEILFRSGEEVV